MGLEEQVAEILQGAPVPSGATYVGLLVGR